MHPERAGRDSNPAVRRAEQSVRRDVSVMNARALTAMMLVLSSASGLLGCATRYKPPTANQPHAILKLRRTYQTGGGTHVREQAEIDGHHAFGALASSEAAGAARTDAILVHPTTAEVRVAAGFFHIEPRLVQETYTVQVPYTTTETYSCGTGTSYQTCTRTVTRYRTETRYRTVMRNVEVSDGACGTELWLSPAVNGAYLLEYEYAEDTLCRLACFEQLPGPTPGTFENHPCVAPTPAQIRRAKDAR